MPYYDEEAGELSESELDALLKNLPRRLEVSDVRRIRSERRLLRSARRSKLFGNGRTWIGVRAATAAVVLFTIGWAAGSIGERNPDPEPTIQATPPRSALERRALVQRAGTDYIRALRAAVSAESDPDALQSVRTAAFAAVRLAGGLAEANAAECLLSVPASPPARLVAF